MPKASRSPRHLTGPCWRTARTSPPPLPLTPTGKPRPSPVHYDGPHLTPPVLCGSQVSPLARKLTTATTTPTHTFSQSPGQPTTPPFGQAIQDSRQDVKSFPRLEGGKVSHTGSHNRSRDTSNMSLEQSNRQFATDIQDLRIEVQGMERSQKRYKAQLRQKAEQLRDERTALEGMCTELIMAEEKVGEMEELVRVLLKDLHRFRRWWLTEYLSFRALLELVPDKDDVEALVTSAEERFQVYIGTL